MQQIGIGCTPKSIHIDRIMRGARVKMKYFASQRTIHLNLCATVSLFTMKVRRFIFVVACILCIWVVSGATNMNRVHLVTLICTHRIIFITTQYETNHNLQSYTVAKDFIWIQLSICHKCSKSVANVKKAFNTIVKWMATKDWYLSTMWQKNCLNTFATANECEVKREERRGARSDKRKTNSHITQNAQSSVLYYCQYVTHRHTRFMYEDGKKGFYIET